MTAVIKYNAGNVQSVMCALRRLKVDAVLSDDENTIRKADHVIFPGVGEAGSAMEYLRRNGMDDFIRSLEMPFLGICLGMQLLLSSSEEGEAETLGIIPGRVRLFEKNRGYKVPHVGWNTVSFSPTSRLFKGIKAIDIIDGRCVRLTKGDYDSLKSYSSDPFSMARRFEDAGLKRLHLVDLDGARGGGIQNLKVLERIAKGTSLSVDFGGGIKSENALSSAFSAGASFVTCGSIAIKDREMTLSLLERYSGRLILGADSKDGIVKASGWLEDGSVDVITFIKSYENA